MSTDIVASVERFLRDLRAVPRDSFDGAWNALAELGLPSLMVREGHGGLGLSWCESYDVLHALGAVPVPLPIAETLVAARLLSKAGVEPPDGALGLSVRARGRVKRGRFTGEIPGLSSGMSTAAVLAATEEGVFLLRREHFRLLARHATPSGEPRDTLVADNTPVLPLPMLPVDSLRLAGALTSSILAAGALERALAMSIEYAGERKQFGRSIGQFQAVQQALAVFGTEVAAVGCATRAAALAADRSDAAFAIGAAKLRCNLAITQCTAIAHQVHGAIGFTREHELRQYTQRLITWRSDYGNDRYWSERLGTTILRRGADQFWPDLTAI